MTIASMSRPASPSPAPTAADHELLRVFEAQGWPLNATLREMLNEHFSHRTERRGSGFTQATRHLARFINGPRQPLESDDLRLFEAWRGEEVRALMARLDLAGPDVSWRSLDARCATQAPDPNDPLQDEARRQCALRAILAMPLLEESRLLARMIVDIVLPPLSADPSVEVLPAWPEDLQIGTCPLAERYFLEIADSYVRRSGRVNIIVSASGLPLLVEKLNLGDDHSCTSLTPLRLNGVTLPPGSLIGVRYGEAAAARPNRHLPGDVIPIERCEGFRFLRLTTLSVSPENRRRAFSSHFEAQVAGGLFDPDRVTVQRIVREAEAQL